MSFGNFGGPFGMNPTGDTRPRSVALARVAEDGTQEVALCGVGSFEPRSLGTKWHCRLEGEDTISFPESYHGKIGTLRDLTG